MRILLLNSSYFPIKIINEKRAIKLLFKGKAEAIDENGEARTFNKVNIDKLPKVLRLIHFSGIPLEVKFSKNAVLRRDGYKCAYTGKYLSPSNRTIDHIIPKSRGGSTSWENCVCCSIDVNRKKGNRTPEEAGLSLLFKPKAPSKMEIIKDIVAETGNVDKAWKPYIPL